MTTGRRSLPPGLLLGLALFAVATPRDAQAQGGAPGVCTADQRQVVREAFEEAERRTRDAIDFLNTRPLDPHVRTWFGEGKRRVVHKRLRLILVGLRLDTRPPMGCDATATRCRTAFATANRRTREINFCPAFFRSRTAGRDARFGVVVHEVSHLTAGTGDVAYGPNASRQLARERPERAVANADNYEYFVELLPR
ncbi:M35 family metallo-endopeptidase [Muricoccus radiodurans]|uniref:M35 family metallo-endopeptidase n=1 Tax=Muricoccus radiodurans TaxID=2231721 RepID=UPI003CE76AA3